MTRLLPLAALTAAGVIYRSARELRDRAKLESEAADRRTDAAADMLADAACVYAEAHTLVLFTLAITDAHEAGDGRRVWDLIAQVQEKVVT